MYSFYYETRGFRAHDVAEPPESWLSQTSLVFARHFAPEAPSARARTLYVSERSPVLELNLGCWLIPLFGGLAGLRDRGMKPWVSDAFLGSYKRLVPPSSGGVPRRRPYSLIKQCSFSSC